MVDDEILRSELQMYEYPTAQEMKNANIEGIHLGDFIFWDDERYVEFLKKEIGWKEDRVEGTYKGYKSVECRMAGVHDYMKYLKRGFGRATDHASKDIRNGLMTREKGIEYILKHDHIKSRDLFIWLDYVGMTEEEFDAL